MEHSSEVGYSNSCLTSDGKQKAPSPSLRRRRCIYNIVFTAVKIYTILCTVKFTINNYYINSFYFTILFTDVFTKRFNFVESRLFTFALFFGICILHFFFGLFFKYNNVNDYLQQFIYNDNVHDVCGACERCVWYVRTMHVVVKQSNVIVCAPINSAVLLRTEALSSVIVDECHECHESETHGRMMHVRGKCVCCVV